jgi:hypothetical protein
VNNFWKFFGLSVIVCALFFLYAFILMNSWNLGLALAIPGLSTVDFITSCWVMIFIFLLKLCFWSYPARAQKTE